MNIFKNLSMGIQLSLFSILLITVTVFSLTMLNIHQKRNDDLARLTQYGYEKTELLCQLSELAMFTEDLESLKKITSSMDDCNHCITILRPDKTVLFTRKMNLEPEESSEELPENLNLFFDKNKIRHANSNDHIDFIGPILKHFSRSSGPA